jgi:hypothetical protein
MQVRLLRRGLTVQNRQLQTPPADRDDDGLEAAQGHPRGPVIGASAKPEDHTPLGLRHHPPGGGDLDPVGQRKAQLEGLVTPLSQRIPEKELGRKQQIPAHPKAPRTPPPAPGQLVQRHPVKHALAVV